MTEPQRYDIDGNYVGPEEDAFDDFNESNQCANCGDALSLDRFGKWLCNRCIEAMDDAEQEEAGSWLEEIP